MRTLRQLSRLLPEALALSLYPLLLWQGRRTRRTALRLPEAPGDRSGQVEGAGEPLRLLVIGESPVAGVGVDRFEESLAPALARACARLSGRPVAWRAIGMNGIRAREGLKLALPDLTELHADLACLAFGVNDCTAFASPSRWRTDLEAWRDALRLNCRVKTLLVAGVPPMRLFPALPMPLAQVLGLKASVLDQVSAEVCRQDPAMVHVPFSGHLLDVRMMAVDGYHPSMAGCESWAAALASAWWARDASRSLEAQREALPFGR